MRFLKVTDHSPHENFKASSVNILKWCTNFNLTHKISGNNLLPPTPCVKSLSKPREPLCKGLEITHTRTHHNRNDSAGRVIGLSHRALSEHTQHSQKTENYSSEGIRTRNLSNRTTQTHALDRTPSGIGGNKRTFKILLLSTRRTSSHTSIFRSISKSTGNYS
jgi:hypothetical protein